MLDPATASAIAALVVAVIALFVALAQAFQQYVASGAVLRLCDSVVYGGRNGLPGRATRRWTFRQFRFRIIYEVPVITIGLDQSRKASFEDGNVSYARQYGGDSDLDSSALSSAQVLSDLKSFDTTYRVGEASWVSFCRRLRANVGAGVAITMSTEDADRCPVDLPNVPIRLPLSEVVQMASLVGLECDEFAGSSLALSMSGPAGTITSSMHPILGLLLHFNPSPLRGLEMKEINVGFPGFHLSRIRGEVVFFDASQSRNLFGTSPRPYVLEARDKALLVSPLPSLDDFRARLRSTQFDELMPLDANPLKVRYAIDGEWTTRSIGYVGVPIVAEKLSTLVINSRGRDPRDPKGIESENESRSVNQLEQGDSIPPNRPKQYIKLTNTNHPWYWLCQMPALWGYWATPWKHSVDVPCCAIAFQSLARYVVELPLEQAVCHRWEPQTWLWNWAKNARGEASWPPYSSPGSIGDYAQIGRVTTASYNTTTHPYFEADLPRLVYSTRYNPASLFFEWDAKAVRYCVKRARMDIVQLAYLDAWLSFAGRTEKLRKGSNRLLQTCPVLVNYFILPFLDEVSMDWVSAGRAIQDDQQFLHTTTTAELHGRMKELGLSEAESLFLMVAITRALGIAICIGIGVNTSEIQSLLGSKVQTFMV